MHTGACSDAASGRVNPLAAVHGSEWLAWLRVQPRQHSAHEFEFVPGDIAWIDEWRRMAYSSVNIGRINGRNFEWR
jgi:hypothetical protein